MTRPTNTTGRMLLPIAMLGVLLLVAMADRSAARAAQAQSAARPAASCPGQPMAVQATGVYTQKAVPEIVINGQPAPGAIWQPGMRSYWHCHTGSQIMMLHDGLGRVQKRGERIRVLQRGDTEYAGPGVEHWHGAAPDTHAHYFQTVIGENTTLWMEEVGRDDYLGNDIGITSRNEFLRTGVRKKSDPAAPAQTPPAPGR